MTELLDIDAAVRAALARRSDLAARWRVRLQMAVAPGVMLQLAPSALDEMLDGLLIQAMEAARGGNILVGAMRQHGRVQVVVADDSTAQRPDLDDIQRSVASLGGTLTIERHPGQGTTIVVSLPGPSADDLAKG